MKKLLIFILAMSLLMVGCAKKEETPEATDTPAEQAESLQEQLTLDYSSKLTDKGFFKDVEASKLVELADYKNITVPKVIHTIDEAQVTSNIDALLAQNATTQKIASRAVEGGDTVNIDYVGSIDGVAFEGGSTNGAGTNVTIGVTNYIDDFLEQLIGHKPGESFDIEVTFPDDYGSEDLKGKDATFAITINHIEETVSPELTDAFVAEKLQESHKVDTVDALKEKIATDLKNEAIIAYIQETLMTKSTIKELPEVVSSYQVDMMRNFYTISAYTYGMQLDEFVKAYARVDNFDAVVEASKVQLDRKAEYSLLVQAIAEEMGFEVTEDNIKSYVKRYTDSEDYSQFEASYGMPYVKNLVMQELVHEYLMENATLAAE